MAGLEVLRLVNEPTAAALAYGWTAAKRAPLRYTIWAAAPFDISILKLRDWHLRGAVTNGDTHLGGDDIDNLLLTIALMRFTRARSRSRRHPGAVQALRKAAIDAKIALSSELAAHSTSSYPTATVTSARFACGLRVADRAGAGAHRRPCKQALADAELKPNRLTRSFSSAVPRAFRRAAASGRDLSLEGARQEASHRAESRRGGGAGRGGAGRHFGRRLEEHRGDAAAGRDATLAGHRALGGPWRASSSAIRRFRSATEHFTTGVDGRPTWITSYRATRAGR